MSTDWSQIDVVETITVMESDIQQSKSEEELSESEEEKIESESEEETPIVSSIIDYVDEPSGARHDNQIQIEGEYFFKASIVRQLFDQHPVIGLNVYKL